VAIAAAAIFIGAIKAAADFEQAMAGVKAVTGATGKDFEDLTAKAKQLGKDTKFSMTEIAEGMEKLGRAGFATTEIIAAMDGVTALSSATMIDLAESAQITATSIRQFGLEAADADRVANLLAATAASSNTTVSSLGESFKYFGPIAKTFGISIESSAAFIGKLGDAGMVGTMATRTLATAMMNLAAPTDGMTAVMDRLNLKFFDANGQFVGLNEMVRRLEVGFKDLNPQQTMAAEAALFGAQSVKQWNTILSLGSEELDTYTEALTGTNAAYDQQAIQLDTLSGQWTILKGSISLLLQTIGEDMMPILKDVLKNAIIPFINGIVTWLEKMGGLRGVVGHAMIAIGQYIQAVANWIGAHEFLRKAIDAVWDVLKGVWSFVKDVFRGDWSAAWQDIKAIAVAALAVIVNVVKAAWDALPIPDETKAKILNVLTAIKDGAVAAFNWIKDKALAAWEGIKASVKENGAGIIEAWDSVKEAGAALWDALKGVFASISKAFGGAGESTVTFRDVVKGAFDIVLTVVTTTLNVIAGLFNILGDALRGDWSQVWIDFKQLISDVWGGIVKILDIIGLKDAILAGWQALKVKTIGIWESIKDAISGVWDGIVRWFDNALQGLINTVTGWMPGWLKKWIGVGEEAGQSFADALESKKPEVEVVATKLSDAAIKQAKAAIDGFYNVGKDAGQGFVDGTNAMLPAVGAASENIGLTAEEKLRAILEAQSPSELFARIGEDTAMGFVAGLLAKGEAIEAAGRKLLEVLPTEEEAKAQGEATGAAYTDGVVDGIQDGTPEVGQAVTEANVAAMESEKEFRDDMAAAYTTANDTEEAALAAHDAAEVEETKTFWQRTLDAVDKGTTDAATAIGNFLSDIKSAFSNGLSSILKDVAKAFASGEASSIPGIIGQGMLDMASAIFNSGIDRAVGWAVDQLWNLVTGAQAAASAVAGAVSSSTAGGAAAGAAGAGAAAGTGAGVLGTIAGIATPLLIGLGALNEPIHKANVWLNEHTGWLNDLLLGNPDLPGIVHQVPAYAMGGIVPGQIGAPQFAVVHGGENITPPGQSSIQVDMRGLYDGAVINVRSDQDIKQIARETYTLYKDRLRSIGRHV